MLKDKKEIAKELLKKAKILGDTELMQMALDILGEVEDDSNKSSELVQKTVIPEYKCENCNNITESAKVIKRCPKCKKHKLVHWTRMELTVPIPIVVTKPKEKEFITKIRDDSEQRSRIRYDEQGNKVGVYARSEPISVKIKAIDTGEDKNDKSNELLKTLTQKSPRTRPKGLVEATCDECHKDFEVSPILLGGSRFICNKCIIKKVPK